MKRFFYLFLFLFIFSNSVWALSLLPRTAYLQYKDHAKEVSTLQKILNSDTDTKISGDGPGSSGKENWFFGALTFEAVKKFQAKYNLEVTGKVNFKTLNKLNSVVQGSTQTTAKISKNTSNNNSENPANPYLDNSNANPYLENSNSNIASPIASPTKKTFLDNTIVGTLVDRLKSLFGSGSANVNTQNLNQTPQCNYDSSGNLVTTDPSGKTINTSGCSQTASFAQNNGSGVCTLISGQTGNSALGCGNGYGNNANQPTNPYANPYGSSNPYSNNLPFGGGGPANTYQPGNIFGNNGTQAPRTPASQSELDLLNGPSCSALQGGADATLVGGGEGGGCGIGTNFGNNPNGSNDSDDGGTGCTDSRGHLYRTRAGEDGQEGIALPKDVQISMFGSLRAACGSWVEVTFVPTGKCQTFRIVDTGPAGYTGAIIDLTGVAENKIGGASRQRYCFRKASNQNPTTN